MSQFSSGFGDYYVGVLYRSGRYGDATALAKGLLDESLVRKEAECMRMVSRAYLILQMSSRLGRFGKPWGQLAAQIQALRHWVHGPEDPARVKSEQVAALAHAGQPGSGVGAKPPRVMGWSNQYLPETPASALGALTSSAYRADTPPILASLPMLQEAPVKVLAPSSKPIAVIKSRPKPAAEPAPAAAKPEPVRKVSVRKPKDETRAAASEPPKQSGHLEDWMQRAFVN